MKTKLRGGHQWHVRQLARVTVQGRGLGSAQGRPVNFLVVTGSHCEAPMTEIEEGRALGVQSTPAGGGSGAFGVGGPRGASDRLVGGRRTVQCRR